jgi:hypothetical protein
MKSGFRVALWVGPQTGYRSAIAMNTKCPSCCAPCLPADDICPGCRRPMVTVTTFQCRSAMWFTTPLFVAIGVTLFLVFPIYDRRGPSSQTDWAEVNYAVLFCGGCGLAGAAVGWFLDWIARSVNK